MTKQFWPIVTPELVEQWFLTAREACPDKCIGGVAVQAARWGADQELEACCEWVQAFADWGDLLRQDRRPQPSLKEQSLALIDKIQTSKEAWDISDLNIVRRALEALPDD